MNNKLVYIALILGSGAISCQENNGCSESESKEPKASDHDNIQGDSLSEEDAVQMVVIDTLEQRIINLGLVDIQQIDSSIHVDLKYASSDNFMGFNMYGKLKRAYLQPEMAERLKRAQVYLKSIDSTLSLLVYDAVRPRFVQQMMWDSIDKPFHEKIKFVSNPKNGSIHNYGAAIDLTIVDTKTGQPLDMGAGYDDPEKIAYPRYEKQFLESGELSKEQYENRKLLRAAMAQGKFWVIQTEWWHFNGCSRQRAKEKYQPLE